MDAVQAGSLLAALAALVGALLAYFKFKPGQRETLQVSVAEATLNIAKGTITMITAEMEDQFRRMSDELTVQRKDITKLRDDVRAAQSQLDTVTQERDALHRENRDLRIKIDRLEGRIAAWERNGAGNSPPEGTPTIGDGK